MQTHPKLQYAGELSLTHSHTNKVVVGNETTLSLKIKCTYHNTYFCKHHSMKNKFKTFLEEHTITYLRKG